MQMYRLSDANAARQLKLAHRAEKRREVVRLDRARELLDYNPWTGTFTWKVKRGNLRAGSVAGSVNENGYRVIHIDDREYRASRLAYFMHYGEWPSRNIRHMDGNRLNDEINNLKDTTSSEINSITALRQSLKRGLDELAARIAKKKPSFGGVSPARDLKPNWSQQYRED
jgi:hypothetical protein